jgi:hypothetical protein
MQSIQTHNIVKNLQALCRNGQVFLTCDELETPEGTTFNVYMSNQPLTGKTIRPTHRIAHHIERHSARDWWQDPWFIYIKGC